MILVSLLFETGAPRGSPSRTCAGLKLSKNSVFGFPLCLPHFSGPKTGAKVRLFLICASFFPLFFRKFFFAVISSGLRRRFFGGSGGLVGEFGELCGFIKADWAGLIG